MTRDSATVIGVPRAGPRNVQIRAGAALFPSPVAALSHHARRAHPQARQLRRARAFEPACRRKRVAANNPDPRSQQGRRPARAPSLSADRLHAGASASPATTWNHAASKEGARPARTRYQSTACMPAQAPPGNNQESRCQQGRRPAPPAPAISQTPARRRKRLAGNNPESR